MRRSPILFLAVLFTLLLGLVSILNAGLDSAESRAALYSVTLQAEETCISENVVSDSEKYAAFDDFVFDLYSTTCLEESGVTEEKLKLAITGYFNLLQSKKIKPKAPLTLVDYSQTSVKPRLFVIDLLEQIIEHESLVAHGRGSGGKVPRYFSNERESHKTSLGFYKTANTYIGQHGYSLRLDGLERGINDRARSRAIVMHGADYVSQAVCNEYGYLGRSWGCPSLPLGQSRSIISSIKNGSCMFLIGNDKDYLRSSELIDEYCASEFFWNNRYQLEQYI